MELPIKTPFYAKASLIFIGLFAFIGMLYITRQIIVPIIYSTIIAIALSPLVNFFVRKKMSRVLAITLTLSLLFLITILFASLLYSQLSVFSESFPKLLDKFYETLNRSVIWASNNFNISKQKCNAFIADTKIEMMSGNQKPLSQPFSLRWRSLSLRKPLRKNSVELCKHLWSRANTALQGTLRDKTAQRP